MSDSNKIGTQISVMNEKNELKKQREQAEALRNRVELLKQQLQKEKETVRKHKQLTKQTIQKKIEVNKINQYKMKDNSDELERINQLRKRNQDIRMSHEKELFDIKKAIYLVKLDDARQVKNMSEEHNRRLKQMDEQFLSGQQARKRKVAEESQAAKERYMKYWKDKLANLYTEQARNVIQMGKEKEHIKRELSKLEEEEIRLMEQINQYHSQGIQSKKEYLAALSLPVKDVAEAMMDSNRNNSQLSAVDRRKSMTINNSRLSSLEEDNPKPRYGDTSRLPNAHVNQDKLKLVLKQIKKVDRNALHTSR